MEQPDNPKYANFVDDLLESLHAAQMQEVVDRYKAYADFFEPRLKQAIADFPSEDIDLDAVSSALFRFLAQLADLSDEPDLRFMVWMGAGMTCFLHDDLGDPSDFAAPDATMHRIMDALMPIFGIDLQDDQ